MKPHIRILGTALLVVGAHSAGPAYARGGCYGNCSENGFAALLIVPLILIYFKYWNTRSGGPDLAKCIGYAVVSALISFAIAFVAFAWLHMPLWVAWLLAACSLGAVFAFLIHPDRHKK